MRRAPLSKKCLPEQPYNGAKNTDKLKKHTCGFARVFFTAVALLRLTVAGLMPPVCPRNFLFTVLYVGFFA